MYQLGSTPTRVRRGALPAGRAGSARTLQLMRELAIEGSKNVKVREAAMRAVLDAGVQSHDFLGEARALFYFVRDRVRFLRDVLNVETLQAPAYTLDRGAGDCDDKATLLAAMLRAIGHPAELRFRVIGTNPAQPDRFTHVFVVARIAGRELALDPTLPRARAGWSFPHPTIVGEVPA